MTRSSVTDRKIPRKPYREVTTLSPRGSGTLIPECAIPCIPNGTIRIIAFGPVRFASKPAWPSPDSKLEAARHKAAGASRRSKAEILDLLRSEGEKFAGWLL